MEHMELMFMVVEVVTLRQEVLVEDGMGVVIVPHCLQAQQEVMRVHHK
jgi:hypothetical protein